MDGLMDDLNDLNETPRARRERLADEADRRAFAAMTTEDLAAAAAWYRQLELNAKSPDRRWNYERLAAPAATEQGRRVTATWHSPESVDTRLAYLNSLTDVNRLSVDTRLAYLNSLTDVNRLMETRLGEEHIDPSHEAPPASDEEAGRQAVRRFMGIADNDPRAQRFPYTTK